MSRLGILLVVSGPSGSGKTTLCRRLADAGEAHYSTSCTTRPMRPGEQNGIDYHFLTLDDFTTRAANGEFLESATVHGNRYGTLKEGVKDLLLQGKDVIMDIDVQGADQVRACDDPIIRLAYADLFVEVPMPELENRLRGRETDSEEVIATRLANAREENACKSRYRYTLVSADRESDYSRFQAVVTAERLRSNLARD